jgi:rhomboid protease GluP
MDKETLQWMRKNCITVSIAVINVIVFLVLEIIGDTENALFMAAHGALYPSFIIEWQEYWRFLTAAFLHFGFLHLLNNMVILLCVGPIMETALGHVKYLILYLLAAVGGGVVSFLEMYLSGDYAVSAGASGAVFGIFGGLLWVVIRNKGKYADLNTKGILFMIVLCLYYGISTAGVDNWGHIGGLITGFVASIILYCF